MHGTRASPFPPSKVKNLRGNKKIRRDGVRRGWLPPIDQ